MSDSIEYPVFPLPQIRPPSSNTVNTDRAMQITTGRNKKVSRVLFDDARTF